MLGRCQPAGAGWAWPCDPWACTSLRSRELRLFALNCPSNARQSPGGFGARRGWRCCHPMHRAASVRSSRTVRPRPRPFLSTSARERAHGATAAGSGVRCQWRGPQWSASVPPRYRLDSRTYLSYEGAAAAMARRSTKTPPPDDFEERILDIDVVDEMQGSFLEYAYSVIYSRALPDARDGLKPVHRRILYQMNEMGLRPDRGYVKCARVVGEVMGKLHPHGDASIYDALVRMAQPFSMRLPLVDGHGNFGSLGNDDPPAAMRYTECRMADADRQLMTESIDEDTVDFAAELRRPGAGAGRASRRVSEPAGQRRVGHRGRHGDEHAAAQSRRGHRRRPAPDQAPGRGPGDADALRAGPRPAHGRPDRRPRTASRTRTRTGRGTFKIRATVAVENVTRPPQGPGRHRTALHRRPREGHRQDQGPGRLEEAARASRTSRTSPTARTACAWSSRSRTASSRRPSWSSSTS